MNRKNGENEIQASEYSGNFIWLMQYIDCLELLEGEKMKKIAERANAGSIRKTNKIGKKGLHMETYWGKHNESRERQYRSWSLYDTPASLSWLISVCFDC